MLDIQLLKQLHQLTQATSGTVHQ